MLFRAGVEVSLFGPMFSFPFTHAESSERFTRGYRFIYLSESMGYVSYAANLAVGDENTMSDVYSSLSEMTTPPF